MISKTLTLSLAFLASAIVPVPAAKAEGATQLAELYVSQACGKCPKAMDIVATEAGEHPEIFVLTWSVDYWNYLGWMDTFAKPGFAERQAAYADKLGARGRYTPMLVFNGAEELPGNKKNAVIKVFGSASPETPFASQSQQSENGDTSVELVEFLPGETRFTPPAGPNRGKEMIYTNLVLSTRTVDPWESDDMASACPSVCAVIVSDADTGQVMDVWQTSGATQAAP